MSEKKFDFLIVGAGLFGATFARLATDAGKKCLVIDRRDHIAGNAYTYEEAGIRVHRCGAHSGVIISFQTNSAFTKDTGIIDPKVQLYGPVVSVLPGPISVWNVQIVG